MNKLKKANSLPEHENVRMSHMLTWKLVNQNRPASLQVALRVARPHVRRATGVICTATVSEQAKMS